MFEAKERRGQKDVEAETSNVLRINWRRFMYYETKPLIIGLQKSSTDPSILGVHGLDLLVLGVAIPLIRKVVWVVAFRMRIGVGIWFGEVAVH